MEMRDSSLLCTLLFFLSHYGGVFGREQQTAATRYVVAGESVLLPCSMPGLNDLLKWRFVRNGTSIISDAAQVFPGGLTSIFGQFNLPPGRSNIVNGMLQVGEVSVPDEGEYFCEISSVANEGVFSDKLPVHVWVTPQEPQVIPLGNGTVLEYTKTPVARCTSKAGKPESKLTWLNGSVPLVTSAVPIVSKNAFSNDLWDISLDLVLENPTRFDHRRQFTCLIEHPAYKEQPKSLNHSVNVLYHPVNIRIWANLTSLMVYCEATGYPDPKYSWVIPGNLDGFDGPELLMADLYSLPAYEYFECTADNGIPPAATSRIMVEDLRWPDGKPVAKFLGLEVYVWAAIGGGILALIIIIIIVVCCYCKKKKKDVGYNSKKLGVTAKYSKPVVNVSGMRHSQPSLLEFDSMRTPDGRESSKPPSEVGHSKASMARSYSLEHLVEEKYGHDPRNSATIVPLNHRSRENLYGDASLNRRASREEIDKVVDHIEVLNKSWDHLAQSREHLNRSREELHVELPPQYRSQDDLHQSHDYAGSREHQNKQDSYPYMDDTLNQRDNRRGRQESNSYSNRDYYEHEIIQPRYNNNGHDGYQDNQQYGTSSGNYDGRNYGGPNENYDTRGYNDNQYNYQDNNRYDDQQDYRQGNQNYNQSQYGYDDRNRNASYGDGEFDDDNRNYDYDQRGYQPASMI